VSLSYPLYFVKRGQIKDMLSIMSQSGETNLLLFHYILFTGETKNPIKTATLSSYLNLYHEHSPLYEV